MLSYKENVVYLVFLFFTTRIMLIFSLTLGVLITLPLILIYWERRIFNYIAQNNNKDQQQFEFLSQKIESTQTFLLKELQTHHLHLTEGMHQNQMAQTQRIQEQLALAMQDMRAQLDHSFKHHTEGLTQHVGALTQEVRHHLTRMAEQVHERLTEGFEKSSATFGDVLKRLTIIDEAQKKIAELSSNVVSLQEILSDKRSRGAFGEVQLSALIKNMIPHQHCAFQYTLSNGKRADCILFLPHPTGQIVIDSKFPLETYQQMMVVNNADRAKLMQQFRLDIKKHINDIAEKYIIPLETADGAMMFIPAEAVFAEIHAHFPDLVQLSHTSKVWMVSPTTLMAILTTARAVLKDEATRQQVHILQKHLKLLSEDFKRFDKRMDNLTKHIELAHQDVEDVGVSAKKITQRFDKIEHLELEAQGSIQDPIQEKHQENRVNSEIT